MSIVDIVAFTVGVLGFAWGANCHYELWKWARQCQNARIVVAHKQRVKLNAPLTDWLGWANQLNKDQASTGRVIYRVGHASVAIVRLNVPRRNIWAGIKRVRVARKSRKTGTPKQ